MQQRRYALFRTAREKAGGSKCLWERFRELLTEFYIRGWETLYRTITFGYRKTELATVTGCATGRVLRGVMRPPDISTHCPEGLPCPHTRENPIQTTRFAKPIS